MKLRKRQIEAIAEQLETVEHDELEVHLHADDGGRLRMLVRDRWGVDHLEIGPDGLVTQQSVGARRRA